MFPLLERLEECMSHVYGEIETPMVPSSPKVPEGLICVANYQGQWTRAQVIRPNLRCMTPLPCYVDLRLERGFVLLFPGHFARPRSKSVLDQVVGLGRLQHLPGERSQADQG